MCNFPAQQLADYKMEQAHRCDTIDLSTERGMALVRDLMREAVLIDRLRLAHADADGCECCFATVGADETRRILAEDRNAVAAGQ